MGAKSCKPCAKKKKFVPGGSILDRVISQSSNQDQCLLYKLANYKKGGELIDAYNIGGTIEVEKLIREQFGQLMYQDGRGQIINRAEYLRWKFRDQDKVVLPIEASLSPYDPLAQWSDHEACWQMQYRGSLGETLLHVLIICDTKIHTKLARLLIKCFPKLALDVVEGEEYLGASSLHLAIAYFNNELVQDLVEAGANVNQRAIGSFFLPRDQQRAKPAKHTDYEGLAYLGEYPLAWAACCANESVYNLLLDVDAHPDLQDRFGNMILHMVVVCDKLDMFGYALRHPKQPARNGVANAAGLTPLTLSCQLGRADVFKEMLELSAREFWRYSNITCSGYPLNALDTLLPDGRTNYNSALFIILNGTKEEHLDMLDGGIIQRLLEEKWKTFARNQFLKRLLILMVHLILLSLAVYLRPDDPDEPLLGYTTDVVTMSRYGCEVGTVLGVLSYVILQQGDEIKNQGILTFLKQQAHSPAKAIFLISNVLILACIPFRIMGDRGTEEAILLIAVPGSWFLLMFFAGAVRLTGPFVTMIYSMITGDMLTFGIIYIIVLFGFSQSFYFLYKGHPGVKASLFSNYPSTWMALFQITLGNYDYADLGLTTYPGISKTVFALFMVFVPILLLNMLIAMMGNTYAHVIEQSEKEWMKQWAKIVITLERAIPQADAHHYLQEYSISLGPSEDPRFEQRGVMVIKSKSKTRAKQRKGAVCNWKRVGKVTVNALKKKGMTGEQMRCLMWGRESINTPVKIKGPRIDPLLDPGGPGLVGGFGGAMTTALDVMAITHDLDINSAAQGLHLADNIGQKPPLVGMPTLQNGQGMTVQQQAGVKNLGNVPNITSDVAMFATLTQLSEGTTTVQPQQMTPAVVAMTPNITQQQPQVLLTPSRLSLTTKHASSSNVLHGITPKPIQVGSVVNVPTISATVGPKIPIMVPAGIPLSPSTSSDISDDPIRALVLHDDNLCPTQASKPSEQPNQDLSNHLLKELATRAAITANTAEVVDTQVQMGPGIPLITTSSAPPAKVSAKNLVGVFAGTETLAKVVEVKKKKYAALDPSDSEGFGEITLLGKVSRTRRAKSANLRRTSAKQHQKYSDKRRLFAKSSSSSSTDTLLAAEAVIKDGGGKEDGQLDYAAMRIQQVKESLLSEVHNVDRESLRPINIDIAYGTATSSTISDTMQIVGDGSGVDTESVNIEKPKRKKRAKTAKINRVSPMDYSKTRSCKSAKLEKSESDSDPDPLDSWSTKGIADMNKILAWEDQEEQDSA